MRSTVMLLLALACALASSVSAGQRYYQHPRSCLKVAAATTANLLSAKQAQALVGTWDLEVGHPHHACALATACWGTHSVQQLPGRPAVALPWWWCPEQRGCSAKPRNFREADNTPLRFAGTPHEL